MGIFRVIANNRPGLGLFLALILVLFFTGCPGGGPSADSAGLGERPLRILAVGDPFASTLSKNKGLIEEQLGRRIELTQLDYTNTLAFILANAGDLESQYDLVSFDLVWLAELVEAGALAPLDAEWLSLEGDEREDFLELTVEVNRYEGSLYGLPIQPHAELLWIREDLFVANGIAVPETPEAVLAAARQLHRPGDGFYGICWNAHRGHPLGQTMAHFYAAFGGRILSEEGEPQLNTEAGRRAAQYALDLLEVSPPDILFMAWDERIERFASGKAAMTYGWMARHSAVSNHPSSVVNGAVAYLPAPVSEGTARRTVFGQWSFGIPENLSAEERAQAWEFLRILTGRPLSRLLMQEGNIGLSRRSLGNDSELQRIHPPFPVMLELAEAGLLDADIRPRITQWTALSELLGTVFFELLAGRSSVEETLAAAQAGAETLLQEVP
jgi:multiple sugar transport system substrate-binding protein